MGSTGTKYAGRRVARTASVVVVALLVAIIASLATQAGTASATTIAAPSSVGPNFQGWTKLQSGYTSCGYDIGTGSVTTCRPERYPAYEWTASGWQSRTLAADTWVYVYPYAAGYSWVYTQRTGWYAIQRSYIAPPGGGGATL
ncbi:MAG: hypothetical protein JWM98_2545 [Thermoleophilia bacterium]|nr:hypothetical protein [Thermoleophilia bacterium]